MKLDGQVTLCDGTVLSLPTMLDYKLSSSDGSACDSLELCCLLEDWSQAAQLKMAVSVVFYADGIQRFCGLLDEILLEQSSKGKNMRLYARSYAARLLDNDAQEIVYAYATWSDIYRNHVQPYGIAVNCTASLPAVANFSVSSGSSEWAVLARFCGSYGGQKLRVDRMGVLQIGDGKSGRTLRIGEKTPLTALSYRLKRYGVVSQVLAYETGEPVPSSVTNGSFSALGSQARKRILLNKGSGAARRLQAAQRVIDESMEKWESVSLTLPFPFAAEVGDVLEIERLGRSMTVCSADSTPQATELECI